MKISLRYTGLAFIILIVSACAQGLDKTPDLTSIEKYQEKITADFKSVPKQSVDAYEWAVSDQTIESLRATYSGKSYRQIANAEIAKEIAANDAAIPSLEKAKAQFDPILRDLKQVTVNTSGGAVSDEFGGPAFSFVAEINNGSRLNFSSLEWEAQLYLDGATTPVAKATLRSSYDDSGGLNAGATSKEKMSPDTFFSKDWITLASKAAKERKVVLSLVDAKDFNNKSFLDGAPYAELSKRKAALVSAHKCKQILET